jgi:hypothetical protein
MEKYKSPVILTAFSCFTLPTEKINVTAYGGKLI